MYNGISAREDFNNSVRIFENVFAPFMKAGENVVDKFKLTQSAIRLEQPLAANSTLYTFPIMTNILSQNSTIFNTEIRLNPQDTLVPTHVGIFLAAPASTTDTAFRLHSYPNQSVFTNALAMRSLYNGQLKIAVNNYQYTYNWDLQRHWFSPQTQQTAAFGAGSPEDQNDFSTDGFYPMQPFVLFGGSQNVNVQIQLAAPPATVDTNSRYVMIFRGILAQNSTPTS